MVSHKTHLASSIRLNTEFVNKHHHSSFMPFLSSMVDGLQPILPKE